MKDFDLSLLKAAQAGDKEAAEKLLLANSGLIWSIVRRFLGRGIDNDDLYQLGCVGFIKAIHGFDTEYGTRFSTYAVPKIMGEIRRFLRDDGTVKVSRGIKEKAMLIRSAHESLTQKLGREPLLSELSEVTGLSAEEIAVAENATGAAESLHSEISEDGFSLESILGDYDYEEKLMETVALKEAIEKLDKKEQAVIYLRYYRGMTQSNTAKILKVSQVQISRLERRAIEQLKKFLA